jgi:hypothetical protein
MKRLPESVHLMGVGQMELQHRSPYDPVKAHEYYVRTRQLKGRRGGQKAQPSTYKVDLASGRTVDLSQQQLIEQRAYAAKRVNDIKKSLAELNTKLKTAMVEARKKKTQSAKPKTAADKSKAARQSKQYREKHKTELATKRHTQAKKESKKSDPVVALQHKITKIKDNLQTALAKQRALAAATRNQ